MLSPIPFKDCSSRHEIMGLYLSYIPYVLGFLVFRHADFSAFAARSAERKADAARGHVRHRTDVGLGERPHRAQ